MIVMGAPDPGIPAGRRHPAGPDRLRGAACRWADPVAGGTCREAQGGSGNVRRGGAHPSRRRDRVCRNGQGSVSLRQGKAA